VLGVRILELHRDLRSGRSQLCGAAAGNKN
jgi:hypothetical protein